MNRAYAIFHVKAVDADRRLIAGVATTPEPDRSGDVIEPLGVSFKNPLPLLLYHDAKKPVGWTKFSKPTKDGIEFEASLPVIDEPGALRDRVEEAWQSVKAGLISGVSIGFRSIEEAFNKETNGFRFLKTEVVELSLVTVPANASATIHSIKALDLAASGLHLPGVTGLTSHKKSMTTQEQITQFEHTRAAQAAIMTNLLAKSAETGESLDEAQSTEYEDAKAKVASCDTHLVRLHDVEKLNLKAATPITAQTPAQASDQRGGVPVIQVKSLLPKGTAFARMVQCLAVAQGDSFKAMDRARSYKDAPEVELMVKAAVAAGTTTDATWAGPLVVAQPLVNEFLELLRPRTLVGRIPGLRHVPFNVSVPIQTGGGTYGWVGQGLAKPVTAAAFGTIAVPFAKAAGIIVITEELAKLSTPSAEATVREEMIAGIGQFLDVQFITVAVAAVANVNPASITNGAPTAAASGVTAAAAKTDLAAAVATFPAANIPLDGAVWIMNDSNAFGLSMAMNALGQPMFPGIGMDGGTLFGRPVIVSNAAGALVVLAHAPSILIADEGGVRIDVSREATIQMDGAPMVPDATTVFRSLWQDNLIGIRAERMITWIRARTAAVRVITAAAYTGA